MAGRFSLLKKRFANDSALVFDTFDKAVAANPAAHPLNIQTGRSIQG